MYRYDLMIACKEVGEGTRLAPELHGDMKIDPIIKVEAYDVKLDATRTQSAQVADLLKRYVDRGKNYRSLSVDLGVNI